MANTYTPGPWEIHGVGVQRWHFNGRDGVDAVAIWKDDGSGTCSPVAWVHPYLRLGDPTPDAHLIATAPDLLEALKTLVNDAASVGDRYLDLQQAKAVIAKAEGR